jgi:hypothetical protein
MDKKIDRLIDLLNKPAEQEPVDALIDRCIERYEEKKRKTAIERNWWPTKMRQEIARQRRNRET